MVDRAFELIPVAGAIGAEVRGVDLSKELDDDGFEGTGKPDRLIFGSDYGIFSPKWIIESFMKSKCSCAAKFSCSIRC